MRFDSGVELKLAEQATDLHDFGNNLLLHFKENVHLQQVKFTLQMETSASTVLIDRQVRRAAIAFSLCRNLHPSTVT